MEYGYFPYSPYSGATASSPAMSQGPSKLLEQDLAPELTVQFCDSKVPEGSFLRAQCLPTRKILITFGE